MFLASDSIQKCYVTQNTQSLPKHVNREGTQPAGTAEAMVADTHGGAGTGEMHHQGRTAAGFRMMSEMTIAKEHNCKESQAGSTWGKS